MDASRIVDNNYQVGNDNIVYPKDLDERLDDFISDCWNINSKVNNFVMGLWDYVGSYVSTESRWVKGANNIFLIAKAAFLGVSDAFKNIIARGHPLIISGVIQYILLNNRTEDPTYHILAGTIVFLAGARIFQINYKVQNNGVVNDSIAIGTKEFVIFKREENLHRKYWLIVGYLTMAVGAIHITYGVYNQHLFSLNQSHEMIEYYRQRIQSCTHSNNVFNEARKNELSIKFPSSESSK